MPMHRTVPCPWNRFMLTISKPQWICELWTFPARWTFPRQAWTAASCRVEWSNTVRTHTHCCHNPNCLTHRSASSVIRHCELIQAHCRMWAARHDTSWKTRSKIVQSNMNVQCFHNYKPRHHHSSEKRTDPFFPLAPFRSNGKLSILRPLFRTPSGLRVSVGRWKSVRMCMCVCARKNYFPSTIYKPINWLQPTNGTGK